MTNSQITLSVLSLPAHERFQLGKRLLESVAEDVFKPSLEEELAAWDRASDEALTNEEVRLTATDR